MNYIALKNCRISGRNYFKGDKIYSSDLSVYDGARLIRYGFISELPIDEGVLLSTDTIMVGVPILALDGKVLNFSQEDIAEAFKVLQMSADEAVAYVKAIKSDTLCDLLGFVDKRKGVYTALSKRSAMMDGVKTETEENIKQESFENGGDE